MLEMVRGRKNSEKKEERYDLFSNLLGAANVDLDGEPKLADRELMGEQHGAQDNTSYSSRFLQGTYLSSSSPDMK